MLKAIITIGLGLAASWPTYGQTAEKALTFDAVSVKPATLPPPGAGVTQDPGRIHYPFISLRLLLMNAYEMKSVQIQGPAWLDTERFDVNATMPPETTREQLRVMLQNLLTERFKLTLHRETKELPMYSLTAAKNGPKMKESATGSPNNAGPAPPPPMPTQPRIGADGFPEFPLPTGGRGGLFLMSMPGRARLIGRQQTMQDLADRLTAQLSRPVSDATGLTGKYDFTLTFSTEGMTPAGPTRPGSGGMMVPVAPPSGGAADAARASLPEAESPPDIFKALKEQLGLALESKKGPVELIVIDHIEKRPSEN